MQNGIYKCTLNVTFTRTHYPFIHLEKGGGPFCEGIFFKGDFWNFGCPTDFSKGFFGPYLPKVKLGISSKNL